MGVVYLGYINGTPIASGNNIPMNTIIRRQSTNTSTDMTVRGTGYYKVTVDANLASTAGGEATITLLQNGVAVVGASATETIDATGTAHLNFSAIIRNTCCNNTSVLTLAYTGAVLTGTEATVIIESV